MYGQSVVSLPQAGVGIGGVTTGGAIYFGWQYLAAVAIFMLITGFGAMLRDHLRRGGVRP